MTEQSAAELRRENDELREQLRERTRGDAAEKAGLDRKTARWITGDTPEEADADARKLAGELGSNPAPTPRHETRSTAQALGEKYAEQRELGSTLSGNGQPVPDGEGRE